jgi:hypothetical protein
MPQWLLWTILLACTGWCLTRLGSVLLPIRTGRIEPVKVIASWRLQRMYAARTVPPDAPCNGGSGQASTIRR